MASGTTEAYVKLSHTEKGYAREARAYRHAVRFAPHEVPRLLADAGHHDLGLVRTDRPGAHLAAEAETQVHEHAGRLLRRWYDLPEPVTDKVRDAIKVAVAEQADEAAV